MVIPPPPPPFPPMKAAHSNSQFTLHTVTCTHTLIIAQEAVECVKEMKSPGMLHVFVRKAINYALENTSECRQLVGQLFNQLLQDGTLAVDRMVVG